MTPARNMICLVTILLLASCTRSPSHRLTWREYWEILAITDSGTVLEARVGAGNTGLLRGQGEVWFTLFPPMESPLMLHRSTAGVWRSRTGDELRLAYDRIEMQQEQWVFSLREDEAHMDATLVLAATPLPVNATNDQHRGVPPTVLREGQRQWTVGVPIPLASLSGAWSSQAEGDVLRGTGVALRRAGDTWPGKVPRVSLYVMDATWSVGMESLGMSPSIVERIHQRPLGTENPETRALTWFASSKDGLQVGRSISIRRDLDRAFFDFSPDIPITVTMETDQDFLSMDPWENLLFFEKWTARALGASRRRTMRRGMALVEGAGEPRRARAILLESGPSGD